MVEVHVNIYRQRVALLLARLEWFRIAWALGVRDDHEVSAYFALLDRDARRRAIRRVWFN